MPFLYLGTAARTARFFMTQVTFLLCFWLTITTLWSYKNGGCCSLFCSAHAIAGVAADVVTTAPVIVTASPWMSNLHAFVAGGVGGVCSVLVGHPFDLIKVQMQTATTGQDNNQKRSNSKAHSSNSSRPPSTFGILKDIVQQQGLRGLYRGVSAPLIAVAPIWAVNFWGFDTGEKIIRALTTSTSATLQQQQPMTLAQLCFAGGFSALPMAIVMVPSERIKCLLQIQQQSSQLEQLQQASGGRKLLGGKGEIKDKPYTGFADCATRIYKESGVKGLYKGLVLTLMRDVPGCMLYFGSYTLAKNALGDSPGAALASGALAGVCSWPFILPIDCLKSRYQTAPDGTYQNIGQVYTKLVQQEGVAGLFKGMGPAVIRSVPANAVSFLGVELTKAALKKFI